MWVKKFFIFTAFTLLLAPLSLAHSQARSCYQLPIFSYAGRNSGVAPTHEIWCYEKRKSGSNRYLLLFELNPKLKNIREDRSALVQVSSKGRPIDLTVGTAIASDITQKVHFDALPTVNLNPFLVPLDLKSAKRLGKKLSLSELRPFGRIDSDALFKKLQSVVNLRAKEPLEAGHFSATIPDSRFPFNGFWWSHQGLPMAEGPNSPLGIYDQSLFARQGVDPQSRIWESENHSEIPRSGVAIAMVGLLAPFYFQNRRSHFSIPSPTVL